MMLPRLIRTFHPMTFWLPALLLPLVVPAVSASGVAQTAATAPADRAVISSCLADSADSPMACIGSVAVVCARLNPDETAQGNVACAERETAIWRERLDGAASELAKGLDPGPRDRFAAVQQAWETYSTLKCGFLSEEAPPERSQAFKTGCELREVALRAIEVEKLLKRMRKVQ